jgi:xylulokinase
VLEGIAYSLKDAASVFQEGEGWPKPQTMTVVGGGTRSEVLTRVLCDVFGQPIRVNADADSAYGAALLALRSVGERRDSNEAPVSEPGTSLMAPDPDASRRYADGFATFRAIQERLRAYYHDAASKTLGGLRGQA